MSETINANYFISLFHDTRYQLADGSYPVKLRVFTQIPRKQMLYSTKYKLTEKDFKGAWMAKRPKDEYKDLRNELQAVKDRAEAEAKKLKPFDFDLLEKALLSKKGDSQNVFYQFEKQIQKLKDNKQFGTLNTYELCVKSLKAYLLHKTGKESKALHFAEVSSDWLTDFETYMIEEKKRSHTTVSMYLRTLRTIFNIAIEANEVDRSLYPFGRRKYVVPAAKNVKKALSKETLRKLFDAKPKNNEEERAKNLFFLSYFSNGMNIKDIAELKHQDLKGDALQFIRAKTKTTSKGNLKPVVIHLNEITKPIIKKYMTKDRSPENYLLNILSKEATAFENFRRVKNLTTSINHCIKRLATSAGITENISSYSARHSFATNAIRGGASMEYISEALSHNSLKTTQNYFAGFDDETKKKINDTLLNF